MISFDVKSLFPSIHLDLALDTVRCELERSGSRSINVIDLIMEGVKFCVENTFFTAQNSTFKQITGLPISLGAEGDLIHPQRQG